MLYIYIYFLAFLPSFLLGVCHTPSCRSRWTYGHDLISETLSQTTVTANVLVADGECVNCQRHFCEFYDIFINRVRFQSR